MAKHVDSLRNPSQGRGERLTPHKIKAARQRLVMIRLMVDIMRNLHDAYAPINEPFGTRLETFFVGFCVALGDIEGKPFSVSKIAAYLHMPRTTVKRRLKRLESWDIVYHHGRLYHVRDTMLNSLIGMRSYLQIRRMISKAREELIVLDRADEEGLRPGAPHLSQTITRPDSTSLPVQQWPRSRH